jgi:hypothetical protein
MKHGCTSSRFYRLIAPGRINAMEGNGAHALSLEIVAMLTL